MARSEGRVFTTIWMDADFRALTPGAQRLYLFLLSQPELSFCGCLPLRLGKWERCAAGLKLAELQDQLAELAASRFVVADEVTQEVLVRSFVRRDWVLRSPKLWNPFTAACSNVESEVLRDVLSLELQRALAEEPVHDSLRDKVAKLADVLAVAKPQVNTLCHTVPDTQPDTQPDTLGHTPISRSISRRGSNSTEVQRGKQEALLPEAPLTITQRSKRITDAYAAAEPMCKWSAVNGIVIRAIKSDKYADEEIRDALLRMAQEGRGVTVESLRVELAGLAPGSRNGRVTPTPPGVPEHMLRR